MAEERLDIIINAINNATKALNQVQKDLAGLGAQTTKTEAQFSSFNKKMTTSANGVKKAFSGLAPTATKALKQIETGLKGAGDAADKAGKKFGNFGSKMSGLGDKMRSVSANMLPLTAAVGILGVKAIQTAASFEQSMTNAFSVMGDVTDETKGKLTDFAEQLGRDTAFKASEAADAMYKLASAGLDMGEIIGTLPGVLDLAAASQSDLADVAEQTSVAIRRWYC